MGKVIEIKPRAGEREVNPFDVTSQLDIREQEKLPKLSGRRQNGAGIVLLGCVLLFVGTALLVGALVLVQFIKQRIGG